MSNYVATVQWSRNSAQLITEQLNHGSCWQFDGGNKRAEAIGPSPMRLCHANPESDPEEAFVAALSSHHMLWFLSLAAQQQFVVESYTDTAVGMMKPDETDEIAISKVILHPQVIFAGDTAPTEAQVQSLHQEAHFSSRLASCGKPEVVLTLAA